jgi:hypothetical protein
MDTHKDRKRSRIELDTEASANAQLTNHQTLYFEDGNVIIRLKVGSTLFCVHRTLLSKHSTVFRDLFAQNHETLRGYPSLTVDDDKDDMESLLNAIYDGLCVCSVLTLGRRTDPGHRHVEFPTLNVETFPALAGLLRITTKYQIQRPRATIIERLQIQWPSSLEKHDEKQAALRERLLEQQQQGGGVADNLSVHPASVIGVLRECNYTSPELLTPLFYDLSTRVWQFGSPLAGYHLSPLSPSDTERFIVGLNKLRSLQMTAFVCPLACLRHPPVEHNRSLTCQSELLRMWHNVASSWMVRKQDEHCHAIEDWLGMIRAIRTTCSLAATARDAQKDALCANCCNSLVAAMEQSRRTMWNSLSDFFALVQ